MCTVPQNTCTESEFHEYTGPYIHKNKSRVSSVIIHIYNVLSTKYATDKELTVEKPPQEGICQLFSGITAPF